MDQKQETRVRAKTVAPSEENKGAGHGSLGVVNVFLDRTSKAQVTIMVTFTNQHG
jgi:predicted PhzF superfamily epimerase YddE/YHI9